jgi:hypothetical protein
MARRLTKVTHKVVVMQQDQGALSPVFPRDHGKGIPAKAAVVRTEKDLPVTTFLGYGDVLRDIAFIAADCH